MIQPSGASDDIMSCRGDVGGVFSEDGPRPPVPGEEGSEGGVYSSKTASHWSEAPVATVRRSDADLGFEPEGSVSPDGPYKPWAETLLTLLEDRDGTALFLHFLQTLGCAALLEFWFACRGFQKRHHTCHRHHRTRERDTRHTHLPHTPVSETNV
uniref:RGS domain-containing protein n=1 Tax=Sinocyclocheilus grahami TaxID=75366 RepID=A0A672LVX1_SINGR